MGFGWLLVGYFFSNMMAIWSPLAFAKLVGYPMMIFGLRELAHYHTKLRHAYYVSFLSLPFALYYALYSFSLLGFGTLSPLFTGVFFEVVGWLYLAFSLAFRVVLLPAVAALAAEVALPRLSADAFRNLVFELIYFLVYLFAAMPFAASFATMFTVPLLIVRCACLFLNLWLFYSAYRNIGPEQEAPPEGKTSKEKKGGN